MKGIKYVGLGILLLAGNINLAQAVPYSVSGSFSNPVFSAPRSLHYLFNNDQGSNPYLPAVAEFGWGVDPLTFASSRFRFNGAKGHAGLLTSSPLQFKLGFFKYTNLPTVRAGKTVKVDLNLNLTIGSLAKPLDLHYGLEIHNTHRANTPDSMKIVSMTGKSTFKLSGIGYELKLLGFDRGIMGMTVAENNHSGMHLWASVDKVSAVPLPASVWLFGSALIGLMGISRGRASKQT